jgi:hypothetical protein
MHHNFQSDLSSKVLISFSAKMNPLCNLSTNFTVSVTCEVLFGDTYLFKISFLVIFSTSASLHSLNSLFLFLIILVYSFYLYYSIVLLSSS